MLCYFVKEVTEDAADFFRDVAADALDVVAPSETSDGRFVMPWISSRMTCQELFAPPLPRPFLPLTWPNIKNEVKCRQSIKIESPAAGTLLLPLLFCHSFWRFPGSAHRRCNVAKIMSLCSVP